MGLRTERESLLTQDTAGAHEHSVTREQSTEWERAPRTAARCATLSLGMVVLLAAAIAASSTSPWSATSPPPPPPPAPAILTARPSSEANPGRERDLLLQNEALRKELQRAQAQIVRMRTASAASAASAALSSPAAASTAADGRVPASQSGRRLRRSGKDGSGPAKGNSGGGRRRRPWQGMAKRGGPPERKARKAARKARIKQASAGAPAPGGTTHVIPEGGSLAIECLGGSKVERVSFASFGTPTIGANGSVAVNATCHSARSRRVIEEACLGQSHCCLPISTDNFGRDPCHGSIKTLAVTLHGCDAHVEMTRFKRHCALNGQWLLCDEDIDFLSRFELPEAPQPLLKAVAIMVDTSWRPRLQRYVVDNVRNVTGWHVQLFHGPSNGPKLARLFADLRAARALTLTDLGDDYMEDWQRLSSMMLLDAFWRATLGEKVLVFQPDSIMCPHATRRLDDFLAYDFVGAPMGGAWWMTSDHDSQWGVGCGGFSLRDRAKSILMSNTPACITPAAGRLEDQQLGASWKHIERRCRAAGIEVRKPSRFDAVQFAVEYDLQLDVLPGDDPAMPEGCRANYYVGPKSNGKPKWKPTPMPSTRQCPTRQFVPLACHKCWFWNYKTWKHMVSHCPEVKVMRALRKEYKIGIEFTDWPTRPKPTPLKGPIKADARWQPIDMLHGKCVGDCTFAKPRPFRKTVKGQYHK